MAREFSRKILSRREAFGVGLAALYGTAFAVAPNLNLADYADSAERSTQVPCEESIDIQLEAGVAASSYLGPLASAAFVASALGAGVERRTAAKIALCIPPATVLVSRGFGAFLGFSMKRETC